MVRTAWAISIAAILIVAATANAQGGRLQAVRDDVSAPAPAADKSRDRSGPNDSDDDCGLGSFFGDDAGRVLVLPIYLPMVLLNDEYEHTLLFAPRPYENDYHGYQIMAPEWAKTYYAVDTDDVPRKQWVMRLALENGNDFDGMNRFAGQFKIEHSWRWGVVSNWNFFRERLPCGCIDQTVIGDTNLTFRFAQNEMASMYAGLGVRLLTDRRQTDVGFNFTYGGDWFPMQPIVVSSVFDAGTLGSAGVVHVRGTLGAILHGWELFAGYDFLRIGTTNLQGPLVGVRWWF